MTYTPLDPKCAAILFADLQVGTIELAASNEPARLRRRIVCIRSRTYRNAGKSDCCRQYLGYGLHGTGRMAGGIRQNPNSKGDWNAA